MLVRITARTKAKKVEVRRLRRSLKAMMARLAPEGDFELSVLLVDAGEIRDLNREFLSRDEATDVLSFPQLSRVQILEARPDGGAGTEPVGDIVINLEAAERQAREHGHSTAAELEMLAAHGLLHLFGYDHLDAPGAAEMAGAESELVGRSIITGSTGED
jgi:probable rRNA maturation factor